MAMNRQAAVYMRQGWRHEGVEDQEQALQAWVDGAMLPLKVVWYRDGARAADETWPGFTKLLAAVRSGEVYMLACWRLDRLGFNARDLSEVFTLLGERGVKLVSLVEGIQWAPDDVAGLGRGLASVVRAEREQRIGRLAEGQARARQRGEPVGRPPAITETQAAEVKRLVDEGMTRVAVAKVLGVSRGSVQQALLRAEAAEVATGPGV